MSSGKRKISIRKVIQTLVTIIVVTGFTMAMLSADRSQNHKKISSVHVQIQNSAVVHFLDEGEVMKMLFTDRHLDPEQTTLARLDIHKMEKIARSNPWVSDAQIYVDNERAMEIHITQRIPQVRIFERNGNSYYLDTALKAMPVSEHYVHYAPLVTGVPSLSDDSASRATKGMILSLVSYLAKHKFWNAQVAQVVLGEQNTFELIPVLGKQRILLGDTSRLQEKLNNLFAFYHQVENKVGWEKYETIDLRFEGQVIASPALSWKIPVDRALTNMNWVKAVMASGPKEDKDESVSNALDAVVTAAAPVTAAAVPVAAAAVKPATVTPAAVKPAAVKKSPAVTAKPAHRPGTTADKKPDHAHQVKPAAHAPEKKAVKPPVKTGKKNDHKTDEKKAAAKPAVKKKTVTPPVKPVKKK